MEQENLNSDHTKENLADTFDSFDTLLNNINETFKSTNTEIVTYSSSEKFIKVFPKLISLIMILIILMFGIYFLVRYNVFHSNAIIFEENEVGVIITYFYGEQIRNRTRNKEVRTIILQDLQLNIYRDNQSRNLVLRVIDKEIGNHDEAKLIAEKCHADLIIFGRLYDDGQQSLASIYLYRSNRGIPEGTNLQEVDALKETYQINWQDLSIPPILITELTNCIYEILKLRDLYIVKNLGDIKE